MKLTRIKLEDFRGFGALDLDLTEPGGQEPLGVALLVGGNGAGKSAILDALGGFFTALSSSYGGTPLSPSDIRQGAPRASIEIAFRDWMGIKRPRCCQLVLAARLEREGLMPAEKDPSAYKEWIRQATGIPGRPTGLIVSFDVYRHIPPGRVTGPKLEGIISNRCQLSLAPTVSTEGHIRPRAQHLKQWIVNLDSRRAKAKADRNEDLPLWHTLRHALDTLLHPYTFEGVDDRFEVLFQTPTGRIPIEALSDGFRSVFTIIAELLLRADFATQDPEKVLEQEGVCLIDEIDAHLHPRWQENIIPGLRAMFPNVQFIATTHSEIVVSTVEPQNVFRLEEQDKTFTAVRQDRRFHRPERRVVSIEREVFAERVGEGGRQWVLDPPPEDQRRFWQLFGSAIKPHEQVFVGEGRVLIETLSDVHDRPLPGLEGKSGEAALFFVDRNPDANWSHRCSYILLPKGGEALRIDIDHGWPPSEAVRLVPSLRPPSI